MGLQLLDAVARVFGAIPAGRTIRLREIARRVGASPEEVELALIHLMARGQVQFQRRRRRKAIPRHGAPGARK